MNNNRKTRTSMNNYRSSEVSNQLRSTRINCWENDYARLSPPRSPPPLQGILRRHHTTATADYSFQQRANASDRAGNRGNHHVVIRPAYRPRDSTTGCSKTNDDVGRKTDRKTVVRFWGDVDDQSTREPGRTSMDENNTSSRTRIYADGEMLGLATGMRQLTTRSRSVSDVHLQRIDRQSRIYGRDIQPPARFTTPVDSRHLMAGQGNVVFVTENAIHGTQRPRHHKWSSFLMKMAGRMKTSSSSRAGRANSRPGDSWDATRTVEWRPSEHDRTPSIQRTERSEKLSTILPNFCQSKYDQEPEIRGRGRRQTRRSSTNSDFVRGLSHQPRRQTIADYDPALGRPQSPENSQRMQLRISTSAYDVRGGAGGGGAHLGSTSAYGDFDPYRSDAAVAASTSDDSTSSVDYERIADCTSKITASKMKFSDENEPQIVAPPGGEAIFGNERIYAPPSEQIADQSNWNAERPDVLRSTLLDSYYPQSDYLDTSRALNDGAESQSKCENKRNYIIKRMTSHDDSTTQELKVPPPSGTSFVDADGKLESRSTNSSFVRRSASDYVIPHWRPSGSDLARPTDNQSASTFRPKLSSNPAGAIYGLSKRDSDLDRLGPGPADFLHARFNSNSTKSDVNDRARLSPRHYEVAVKTGSQRLDGSHGSLGNIDCTARSIDCPEQLQLTAPVTSSDGDDGDYDNLVWDTTPRSDGYDIKPVPADVRPFRRDAGLKVPTIVVESVPPVPKHVTAVQNGIRNYVALYAWSPEFRTVRTSPTSTGVTTAAPRDHGSHARDDARQMNVAKSRNGVDEPPIPPRPPKSSPSIGEQQRHANGVVSWLHNFTDVFGVKQNRVSERDIARIEMFYRSNKTEVIVCACVARLYRSTTVNGPLQTVAATTPDAQNGVRWFPTALVGVPVIVIDSGESRCRDRKLYMLLADICSGCSLWREVIDHLSDYRALSNWFHVMKSSRDHTRLAGLLFANEGDAADYHTKLRELTSGPTGDRLLSLSGRSNEKGPRYKLSPSMLRCTSFFHGGRPKRNDQGKKTIIANLKKSEISAPCCFEHVSTFNRMPAFLVSGGLTKSQSEFTFPSSSNAL